MEELQQKIQNLLKNISRDNFIFELLSIYGNTNTTIKRLRDGDKNKLHEKGELELRKKLFFKEVESDLYSTIDDIKNNLKGKRTDPRFIIVTDYKTILAFDTKTKDSLDIKIDELDKKYNFFLPWLGIEKTEYQDENIADVKAAQDLAKLYDEIIKTNPHESEQDIRNLNIFLSRLLFCYFAEDTEIFEKNQFTNTLASHTQENGNDTKNLLEKLFIIFNQKTDERKTDLPDYLNDFPYVNGKLFAEQYSIPGFTTKSRRILIEMGSLDWSQINPDIFGSMMQAVVSSDDRSSFGMHYTSVPNIMKLIKPLFLDELREEFEDSIGNTKKLQELQKRLSKIKFFDPACGSGNFLIITYKEMRRLEIDIIQEIQSGGSMLPGMSLFYSDITLSQFYGIEIDNFAHETAKLSLYLAEHQMNVEFEKKTGFKTQPLPLKGGGNIVQGNAARVDWELVCPKEDGDEIYIIGNPPYLGARLQDKDQKADMTFVFDNLNIKGFNNLDYIAIWFIKGSFYIKDINAKFAFVTTNSINQGEQVVLLWPHIFNLELEICFAIKSFKWTNNAKANAGVVVSIVGIRNLRKEKKYIYNQGFKQEVKNINAYLLNADEIFVNKRSSPISQIPPMCFGSMANDGGHFFFSEEEYSRLNDSEIVKYIKLAIGGAEFLRGQKKYCLWIEDRDKDIALQNKSVKEIVDKVKNVREKSKRKATQKLASAPHRFAEIRHKKGSSILVPATSSERRVYIPVGFLDDSTIITNATNAVYDAEPWVMGLLSSRIHMIWMKSFAGRLEERYRYSSTLVYNTFPFPKITEQQKEDITDHVYEILDERAKHSEKTLAQMYDPDKMPEGLKNAHHQLDLAIERIYRSKPFENDEERLEYLFKLYEKMIAKEQEIISNKKK